MSAPAARRPIEAAWLEGALAWGLVAVAFVVYRQKSHLFLPSFFLVATTAFALAGTAPIKRLVATLTGYLARRLLFYPEDLERETVRIDLLRIIAGALLCHRTYQNIQYLAYTDYTTYEMAILSAILAAGACLMVGFLTPIAAIFLLITYRQFGDYGVKVYTLSTDIMQMILMVLVFAPSGTRLSVDSKLSVRLHSVFGHPTADRIALARFAAMLSYGVLCLYSVIRHTTDPGWLYGYVIAHATTAAATGKQFEFVREVQNLAPAAFFYASRILTYLMGLWEALFIPLVLGTRLTRMFAAVWGLLFFAMSSVFLVVQWLPSFQFVLFALIFWSRFGVNVNGSNAMVIYYDDRCNLCDGTVRTLRWVDIFTVLSFRPLSMHKEEVERYSVSIDFALRDLVGRDPSTGTLFAGYALYLEITRRLLLLIPLYPVLVLGRLAGVGPAVYRRIADNRTRWFGVCRRPPPPPLSVVPTMRVDRPRVVRAFAVSFVIMVALSAFRPPIVRSWVNHGYLPDGLISTSAVYGLVSISVFNQDWLPLSENYFTMEAVTADGKRELLPFMGRDGQYLRWPNWSDRAFITDSLRWRMSLVRQKVGCYDEKRDARSLLRSCGVFQARVPRPSQATCFLLP